MYTRGNMDLSKREYKDLADAVGMPDDEDYKKILKIIETYERKHPEELRTLRDIAREQTAAGNNDWGLVKADGVKWNTSLSGHRYMLELPLPLHEKIERYIPTIFSNKRHFAWFCKKFPGLLIPRKY